MELQEFKNIVSKVIKFEDQVESFKKNKQKQFDSVQTPRVSDIVVLTSTQDEFDSFSKLLTELQKIPVNNDSTIYFKGYIESSTKRFSVVMPLPTDMGIAAAAIISTKCINNFRPKYLFMVGIAAGIKSSTKIGDVIIAEKSLDYNEVVEIENSDKSVRTKFMNSLNSIPPNLKSRMQLFLKSFIINDTSDDKILINLGREVQSHFGTMVTGSSLVRSSERVSQLVKDFHNIKGIDMETIGVYKSVMSFDSASAPQFLSLKSVSDYGMNEQDKEFKNSSDRKKIALLTSSLTLFEFIKSEHFQ